MTLCQSGGRHRDEKFHYGVRCSARRSSFFQSCAPETQFAESALSQVEGPLQGTGPLPRSGGLTSRLPGVVNNEG